jgi:prevent-host-death family protein
MRTATISQTKNGLSALLDRVRQGESVVITDRSRPVARLEPILASREPDADAGRLARLERAGVVRRARSPRLAEILNTAPPSPVAGADVVQVLLEERRAER